jgi:hypothetical protein
VSSDPNADDVYQPTGDNEEQEDAAPLDLEDALQEDDYDDVLDKGYSPPERPLGVNRTGTTAEEQRRGESLDEHLAEEVPDVGADMESAGGPDTGAGAGSGGVGDGIGDGIGDAPGTDGEPLDPEAGGPRSGRLTDPDQGNAMTTDDDLQAESVGIDGGAATAEEAAVHVVEDPQAPPEREV